MRAVPNEPEPPPPLGARIQTALETVLYTDEEVAPDVEAAAKEIEQIVKRALGPHVSELRLHPGTSVPGMTPSVAGQ
jgi:hypothetical protein